MEKLHYVIQGVYLFVFSIHPKNEKLTMKRFLWFLCLLPLMLAAVQQDLYIFSAARSLKQDWKLSEATMTQKAWPNGEPGLTGFVTFNASKGWPSVKLAIPEEAKDWRSVKSVSMEIYCPARCSFHIEIATDHDKKNMPWYGLTYSEGRHTVVMNIEDKTDWDLSSVKFLDVFVSQPKAPVSFYIGNFSMEMRDPEKEAEQHRAQGAKLKNDVAWRLDALGSARADQFRSLRAMARILPETPEADELDRLAEECRKQFPLMDKELFKRSGKSAGLSLLWCLPEEKIHRGDYAFIVQPTESYTLDVARGEGESAQLVGYAPQALQGVKAELDGLPKMADGTVIPREALKLAPLGYVNCPSSHYVVTYSGYWPDPILEYLQTPIPMEEDKYQSWWLDVQVPADQKPGLYTGSIKVTYDNGVQDMPYSIQVRGFALEHGVPYFSPVGYNALAGWPDAEKYKEAVADLLITHRMQPDDIYYGCNKHNAVETNKKVLVKGAKYFNMGYVNGPLNDKQVQSIADYYQKYKEEGMLDKAYIYCFDEATPERFPMIRETLLKVRKAAPGVPIYTTLYDGTFGIASNLDDVIDGWIPGTVSFSQNDKNIKAARARGRKVGWYVACSPYLPYANFLLEYPAVAPRLLMGFMPKKLNNDDVFLYYAACMFWEWKKTDKGYEKKGDITTPVTGGPILGDPWNGASFQDFNGDGRLVYAAAEGPIPCVRLKYIRDGVEDWMYVDLLQKCLENCDMMSQDWQDIARHEVKIEDELVTSLTTWTRDPMLIYQKRAILADLLEQYFAAQK